MEIKNLTNDELRRDYDGRHGFVFKTAGKCNTDKCDQMCDALIKGGITEVGAEFVILSDNDTMMKFVYPEGVSFNAPFFWRKATHFSNMLQAFKIDTLGSYLKYN